MLVSPISINFRKDLTKKYSFYNYPTQDKIIKYIEGILTKSTTGVVTIFYHNIADDLKLPLSFFHDLYIDGGSNGFTVCTQEYYNKEFVNKK